MNGTPNLWCRDHAQVHAITPDRVMDRNRAFMILVLDHEGAAKSLCDSA